MENYEIEISLPLILNCIYENKNSLLIENILEIEFPVYKQPEIKYKYTYIGSPVPPVLTDLVITIPKNEDDENTKYTFRCLKDWFDLDWNNETGCLSYRTPMKGQITLTRFGKRGDIIEKINYYNCKMVDCKYDDDYKFTFSVDFMTLDRY